MKDQKKKKKYLRIVTIKTRAKIESKLTKGCVFSDYAPAKLNDNLQWLSTADYITSIGCGQLRYYVMYTNS